MVPTMIVYDVVTKVPDTESFPQHSITGLISGITFIVLFSQNFTVEGNKHTHTHAHTHTHIYIYIYIYIYIHTQHTAILQIAR